MEQKESLFLAYVRQTFKRWNGFQAAMNEGMGGPYAKEKEEWLGNEVENYFKHYDVVTPDDIEEYLGAMLENEFDTYFEDGSLKEVSTNFCTAYRLSKENPSSEIFQDVYKTVKPVLVQPVSYNEPAPESESKEEAPCEGMADLTMSDPEEDDGWTTVLKKNKKVKQDPYLRH